MMTTIRTMSMVDIPLVLLVCMTTCLHRGLRAKDPTDETSRCDSNAMVLAMSACQASRHKLSIASQTNDTAKLCGALQRYSNCMAPRLEGCKGATRMAFDVIRTKYAGHYGCRITPHFGVNNNPFYVGSPYPNQGRPENDYFTPPTRFMDNGDNKNNYFDNGATSEKSHVTTLPQPPLIIISNAVGVKPNTTTNTTNITNSNRNVTFTTPRNGNQHDVSNNTDIVTVESNTKQEEADHTPVLNTRMTNISSPSNTTLTIFDPSSGNAGFNLYRAPTAAFIILTTVTLHFFYIFL